MNKDCDQFLWFLSLKKSLCQKEYQNVKWSLWDGQISYIQYLLCKPLLNMLKSILTHQIHVIQGQSSHKWAGIHPFCKEEWVLELCWHDWLCTGYLHWEWLRTYRLTKIVFISHTDLRFENTEKKSKKTCCAGFNFYFWANNFCLWNIIQIKVCGYLKVTFPSVVLVYQSSIVLKGKRKMSFRGSFELLGAELKQNKHLGFWKMKRTKFHLWV